MEMVLQILLMVILVFQAVGQMMLLYGQILMAMGGQISKALNKVMIVH